MALFRLDNSSSHRMIASVLAGLQRALPPYPELKTPIVISIHNPLNIKPLTVERIIGHAQTGKTGPLLLILVGQHGNEPSGVIALDRVLKELQERQFSIRGSVLGIACNLPALSKGVRYLDVDMNRLWLDERIDQLLTAGNPNNSEEQELLEVIQTIESVSDEQTDRFFLDCHTTSSHSLPFISVHPSIENVHLVRQFPIHAVLGAGSHLQGISDAYLSHHGWTGFTFEAGKHDELASIEAQEAMIWLMLQRVGCLDEAPSFSEPRLSKLQIDGCHHFEVVHIHRLGRDEDFKMQPRFFNFKKIHKGELLAIQNGEPVISDWNAHIFMPLYQNLGDEGFTVIQPID